MFRIALIAVLVCLALPAIGCASYWSNRGDDVSEIIDIGATASQEAGFSLYASFLNLASIGYSDVDGTLYGLARGQGGASRMRQNAWGLIVYGKEQFGYRDFDAGDPGSPEPWGIGLGMLTYGPPRKDQIVSCPKMLHLGWVGLTVNCKFGELFDFLVGWTTLDPMSDDRH